MRRPVLLALALPALLLAACGDGRTARVQSIGTAAIVEPGASCDASVRAEFVRQQSLVYWPVYCPSQLPDGFRLAHEGDARHAPYLEQDYWPTRKDLNPGGGTFITRLVGPDGSNIMIIQGAGASIWVRRDQSGRFEDAAGDARLGDLAGTLFTLDPAAVIAFDALSYGHEVAASGLPIDELRRIAQSMRPVDGAGLRGALFSLADLHGAGADWTVSWPPDPTGEDVRNPQICGLRVDAGPRAAEVEAKFEPATVPGSDAGGHGPFLEQAVVRYDGDGAKHYIDRVVAMLGTCPASFDQTSEAGERLATTTVTKLDDLSLGEQSVAFRRSTRSPVQGADIDVVLIRHGEYVAIVLYFDLVPAGGQGTAPVLRTYAAIADRKLEALDTGLSNAPESTSTPAPPATPAAESRDEIVRRLAIGAFPSNFSYRAYDWSPDGARIVFVGVDRALYVAAAPDYTPQRLAEGPASEPRWSPDGALIAFAQEGEGIEIIPSSSTGSTVPVRVSPVNDLWRSRIIRIYRWLDDRTIAYDAHCGTGCQYLFEMAIDRPADGSLPRGAGTPRHVPFVQPCADCAAAGLEFYYAPDVRSIVADYGGAPSVAWYDRQTGEQWLVEFADDPRGVWACREFVSWDTDSRGFSYRETPASTNCTVQPESWTYWHADPAAHTRTRLPPSSAH